MCAAAPTRAEVLHQGPAVDDLVERYTRHLTEHAWTVDDAPAAVPADAPRWVLTARQPGQVWRIAFSRGDAGLVAVTITPTP